ncbi:MAG: hypothetical protein NVS2B16_25580 [Chloroflexota bacterium]
MADFAATTGLVFRLNTGTLASATSATQTGVVWTTLNNGGSAGANELRFSDGSGNGALGSAAWPLMTRPGATQQVNFQYAATADTTLLGYASGSSTTPTTWLNANFNDCSWSWDAVGTFGSAPIFTAYLDTSHAAITRSPNATNSGTANMLQGSTTDTGATARSYLKGNVFSNLAAPAAPGVAPTNAPVVTDGTTGALTTGAGWLTNYQGLMGDTDWIAYGATPTATTAAFAFMMLTLFTGPNMVTGTYTAPVCSVKYTFS